MQLKFYAHSDQLVAVPGTSQYAGQVARYAGRSVEIKKEGGAEVVSFPATQEGVTVDSESPEAKRYTKLVRRDGALYPADAVTAAACGVPFVALEFADGVWLPKPEKAQKGGK